MNGPGARESAAPPRSAGGQTGRPLPLGRQPDAPRPAASIRSRGRGAGPLRPTAGEVLRITTHLRNIDGKFRNFRELFRKGKYFLMHLFGYKTSRLRSAEAILSHSCCIIYLKR